MCFTYTYNAHLLSVLYSLVLASSGGKEGHQNFALHFGGATKFVAVFVGKSCKKIDRGAVWDTARIPIHK